jgi:hypothetical protein
MPPRRWLSPAQYLGDPLENAPPYPDLVARQFRLSIQHSTRRLGVAGILANVGNSVITRPFKVVIGVTIEWPPVGQDGPVRSQQEIFPIQPPLAPGVQVETPPSPAPLVYYDEEGAIYWLDMIVDVNNDITEYGGARNSITNQKWWAYSPASLASGETIRIGDIAAELEKTRSKRSKGDD